MPSGFEPPFGQGTHYGDTSVVTDVTDIIYQITPEDTPFFHITGDGPASVAGVWHEWQHRALITRQDNAQFEGFNYTFTSPSRLPSRIGNVLHIFGKDIRISRTNQAIGHYAIPNMRADQVEVQLAELKTDIERALLRSTLNTGATGTARRMNGVIPMAMSNQTGFTNVSSATLTEAMFVGQMEDGWGRGAALRDLFVDGRLKRAISNFSGNATRLINADSTKTVYPVDFFETDFGGVNTHLCRDMPTISTGTSLARAILWVDRTHLKKAWLTSVQVEKTAKIADSEDYIAVCELSLEHGNRAAHQLLFNVSSNV